MKIMFLHDDSVSADVRVKMPAAELFRRGFDVTVKPYNKALPGDFMMHDAVVFQRPVVDIRGPVQIMKAAGAAVIVEIDDDFMAIPEDHPGFKVLGRGNAPGIENLYWAIANANLVVTSTEELEARLQPFAKFIRVIPNCWDDTNKLWTHEAIRLANWFWTDRSRVSLGWCGSLTHKRDVAMIADSIKQVLKKHDYVRIVIGADLEIYDMFDKVPEVQKMYIPGIPFEQYPWMVRHFDALLVPLEDNYFTQAKSDVKLVEAGAAGIPYVASDLPMYRKWYDSGPASGILVENGSGWQSAIETMVTHVGLREQWGKNGCEMADARRITKQQGWQQILEEL